MVYRPSQIRTNFQMGEMPVENIIYSRLGGCFITFVQGIFFVFVILALATVACFITYYATNDPSQKSQTKTLNSFIDGEAAAPKHGIFLRTSPSIEPKKYVVAIQPKLDETAQPFTYTGAVYVTFVTNVDSVQSLQLQHNGAEPITKSNVKIFRMMERNDGPVKRSVDENETSTDEEGTTTEKSTTTVEADDKAVVTTTTTTTVAPSTTSIATHVTSSAPKETTNGYTSALEAFSNYFLKYEDRNAEMLIRDAIADSSNDTITIRTLLSLRKNTLYVAKIEFEGNMTETGYGFLLSKYSDETQTRRYFASTNTNSKLAFPIFPTILHDRNHRIPFDVAILSRPQLTSLANSKVMEQFSYRINGSEWKLATFQTTAPMRVCDFSIVVTQITPTLITSAKLTVYAYIREKKSPSFAIADETLAKMTRVLKNVTGVGYYMDRINLVGVPNNRQRSTAPGMIVASENDFVTATRSDDQLQRIANAALLFAKLWYLPLAQYENAFDVWLNDAMPLYLQWHAINSIFGGDDDGEYKVAELLWLDKMTAFENDLDVALIKSIGIENKTIYLSEKMDKYTTDRRRGFYLLRIIERLLGTASFHRAIQNHCRNISHHEESSWMEAFQREIFEKSVDISLTKVVNTWLRTDSHPMVTASVDVQRNELLISQEQLLPQNVSGVQRPVVLPITIRGESNNGSDRIFFIVTNTVATKASDFIGNDTWLLLNPHGTGYYRTNYAPKNWQAIVDSLRDNATAIDKLGLASLIDDAFNLARNGYLNYSTVFKLVEALKGNDTEYSAWKSAMHHLREVLVRSSEICASKIKTFTINLISQTFNEPIEKDERLQNLINRWRCELKMNECSISSGDFHSDSQHIIEIIGAINSTANETSDIEKALNSIGCTSDVDASKAIFNLIFAQDLTRFMPNIVEICGRCDHVRRFVLEQFYEDLPRVLRVTDIENWLPLFERISSEFERKMLDDIYSKYSIYFHPELRAAFKYIVAKINSNLRWKRKIADDCGSIDWEAFT